MDFNSMLVSGALMGAVYLYAANHALEQKPHATAHRRGLVRGDGMDGSNQLGINTSVPNRRMVRTLGPSTYVGPALQNAVWRRLRSRRSNDGYDKINYYRNKGGRSYSQEKKMRLGGSIAQTPINFMSLRKNEAGTYYNGQMEDFVNLPKRV